MFQVLRWCLELFVCFRQPQDKKGAGCCIWRGRTDLYQDNRSPVGRDSWGFIVVSQRRKEGAEDLGGENINYPCLYPPAYACSTYTVLQRVLWTGQRQRYWQQCLYVWKHKSTTVTPAAAATSRASVWHEPFKMWRRTTMKWSMMDPDPPEEPPRWNQLYSYHKYSLSQTLVYKVKGRSLDIGPFLNGLISII